MVYIVSTISLQRHPKRILPCKNRIYYTLVYDTKYTQINAFQELHGIAISFDRKLSWWWLAGVTSRFVAHVSILLNSLYEYIVSYRRLDYLVYVLCYDVSLFLLDIQLAIFTYGLINHPNIQRDALELYIQRVHRFPEFETSTNFKKRTLQVY